MLLFKFNSTVLQLFYSALVPRLIRFREGECKGGDEIIAECKGGDEIIAAMAHPWFFRLFCCFVGLLLSSLQYISVI